MNILKKMYNKLEQEYESKKDERGFWAGPSAGTGMSGPILYQMLTKNEYEKGKLKGRMEGYNDASTLYEDKLLDQARKFEQQKNFLENDIIERDKLLLDYEKYIKKIESDYQKSTEEQKQNYLILLRNYERLKNLQNR